MGGGNGRGMHTSPGAPRGEPYLLRGEEESAGGGKRRECQAAARHGTWDESRAAGPGAGSDAASPAAEPGQLGKAGPSTSSGQCGASEGARQDRKWSLQL